MSQSIKKRVFTGAIAAAVLALGAAAAASAQPGASKMFLSDGQSVAVFLINNQNPGSPVAMIQSQQARGLATERDRLFVTRGTLGDVAIYSTGTLKQAGRLDDRGQQPGSVAIGRNGIIYVGNEFSAKNGAGSVSVYEHGSTKPTKLLTCPSFYEVTGVAVNARGDVFVNQNKSMSGNPEVDMFPAGSNKCHSLNINEYQAGGAAIDPNTNDLLLADVGYRQIDIVAPPYSGVSQTIQLPVCIGEELWDLALDPVTSLLYISDPANGADVLQYPGGSRMATYSMSSPGGIALSR